MSGHAEAGHGHEAGEHGHDTESALETLSDGIMKIIKSVGIAVKKVFNGITGFAKDVFGGLFSKGGHDAHEGGHGTPDAHGAAAAHAPAAGH